MLRISGQDRAQNQVGLRRTGIQVESGARGGDRFRKSIELALCVSQVAEPRRIGSGNVDGAREFVTGLLKVAHAHMLDGEVVVGIRILGRNVDGLFQFFNGLLRLAGLGEPLRGDQCIKRLSRRADGATA